MATHRSILALENPTDRGAWRATVHGIAKGSDTTQWLSKVLDTIITSAVISVSILL